jgi:YVTN family beta-propeller protein
LERRKFLRIAAAAGSTAGMAATSPTDASVLAVVEKKAGKVAFYTAIGKRLSEVKVGTFPHEMVLSPDRRLLYVSDNGLLWMTDKGEGGNTISIIDVESRAKAGVIDLGDNRRPHGIAVVPKTGLLVVTIENPFGVLLIDPVGRRVLRRYEVKGEHPHMVLLGPNGETAWVSNAGSGEVAVINLTSGEVENIIPVGKDPQGGDITRDGKWIYVTNHAGNTISIIDVKQRQVTGEIRTGVGPARIALTADERSLVYNLQEGEGAGFADVATSRETGRIDLPGRPLSLSLARNGRTAYLGLQDSDKVGIVSLPARKMIRVIDTPSGAGPDTVIPL